MANRLARDLSDLTRNLKKLDERVRNRVMRRANQRGIQVAEARAVDIALSKFRGEGFLASQITIQKRRAGRYAIKHSLGVAGGAKAPNLRKGTYRASKTPLRRRGSEKRTGLIGFSDGAAYYWRFLEFGTSKMAARPFLRPAFEGSRTRMLRVVISEVKEGIEREARRLRRG